MLCFSRRTLRIRLVSALTYVLRLEPPHPPTHTLTHENTRIRTHAPFVIPPTHARLCTDAGVIFKLCLNIYIAHAVTVT